MNNAPPKAEETIFIDDHIDGGDEYVVLSKYAEWKFKTPVEYIRADLVPQWQSVETAPKDKTKVLLYLPEKIIVEGLYEYDYWYVEQCSSYLKNSYYFGPPEPTHWMPLPKPPKVTE